MFKPTLGTGQIWSIALLTFLALELFWQVLAEAAAHRFFTGYPLQVQKRLENPRIESNSPKREHGVISVQIVPEIDEFRGISSHDMP